MKTITLHGEEFDYFFFDGSAWIGFKTRADLVNFLSIGNDYSRHDTYSSRNSKLQLIGNNGNDAAAEIIWGDMVYRYTKRYCRVIDKWGRSVYNHELINEVLAHKCDVSALPAWVERPWLKDLRRKYKPKQKYRFRCDPVPGVHHYSHGHYFRSIKTTNERRLCAAPEMQEFNRPKRGLNLPTNYDDRSFHWERGWKFQTKNRHQWEAHAKQR